MENNYMNEELAGISSCKPGWNDCTDVCASDLRKKSFRMFNHSPDLQLLHIFSAGEYYGIEYFHVVHENCTQKKILPEGEYQLMTKIDIKERFNLEF